MDSDLAMNNNDSIILNSFFIALSNKEGIQVDFTGRLLGWMNYETLNDYNIALSRISKIPVQVDQIIDLLKLGVEEGILLHNRSMVSLIYFYF